MSDQNRGAAYVMTRARLLDALAARGDASLTDLAADAGVSRPTVQRALDDLTGLDLVEPRGSRALDRGRPAKLFGLSAGSSYVMGIDAGPLGSRVRIVSLTGQLVVDSVRGPVSGLVPSPVASTTAEDDARATEQVDAFDAVVDHVLDTLAAIGCPASDVFETVMGVPGMVDADGRIELSVVVPSWTGRHLGSELARRTGLPRVTVENDMGLMALGEMYRSDLDRPDLLYVANHGSHRPGVVTDGVLRVGAHRMVGEGFVLESTGLVPDRIAHAGESRPYFEVARQIDAGALDADWLGPFHEVFSRVLALLVFALDPEVVVIGGGPVTTAPAALADLTDRLQALARFGRRPMLLPVSGEDSTLGGAVGVALHGALGAVLEVPDPPVLPVRLPSSPVPTPGGHIHV
jgi:predicted NBD/HSP70 family sugar kinase